MSELRDELPQPPFIVSQNLEDMYRFPVDLGVPLLDEAVTVDRLGSPRNGKTRLEVAKSSYEITIEREDQEPLQVVISGHKMLAQPVGSLVLTRSTRPSSASTPNDAPATRLGWEIADPEVKVDDVYVLGQFANTVGSYALRRQRERYHRWLLWLDSKLP